MNRGLRLKITFESLILLGVVIATLCENDFFRLFEIKASLLQYVALFLIYISFLAIISRRKSMIRLKGKTNFIYFYYMIGCLFLIVQCIYTLTTYRLQTLTSFLQAMQGYLWIAMAVPLLYLFSSYSGIEKVLNIIKYLVFVSLAVIIITAFMHNMLNIEIFNVRYYKQYLHRNGRLRLWDLSSLEGLAVIWTFYEILYLKKDKLKNTIMLVVMMAALFYVEQTRMMQITLISIIAILFVLKKEKGNHTKIAKFLLVIGALFFIFSSENIENFINSFSLSGTFGVSTRIRIEEIKYATQLIMNNLFNGVGLMTNAVRDNYINYGGRGNFGYTDIGFIGLWAQLGVWAILIYILPLCRFAYILYKIKNDKENTHFYFLIGLFVYLLITSGTLIVLNQARIYLWPFCLSIFEYSFYCYKKNDCFSK